MPGVSDPGSRVAAAVAAAGLVVSVVPGPSAAVAALVVSGLPTDRFVFEGFLPRSGRDRKERLAQVAAEGRTSVLFEAPGRVEGTLSELAAVCGGDRPVAVARELTKLHEQVWRGSLAESVAWAGESGVRGEVVLVVGGAPEVDEPEVSDTVLVAAVAERLAAGERTRGAVDGVAATFGVARRRVYALAITAREGGDGGTDREQRPGSEPVA
jgi:16S rRNA (cytidine1402-2'-O)-methyltransferase